MITVKLEREDLIQFIKGRHCPQNDNRWSRWIGNQWNEEWAWNTQALSNATDAELLMLSGLENKVIK